MASVKVVLRARPNKDESHPLLLRISKDRKSIRITIGHSIEKKYWDDKNKAVKKTHPNSARLNNLILKKIAEVTNLILELETKNDDLSIHAIRDKVLNKSKKGSVFQRCDMFFDEMLKANKFNRYSGERAAVNHLKRFCKQRDLQFEDMTEGFVRKFQTYLIGTVGVTESSSINYLITLRTIYNRAIKDEIVDRSYYPFGQGKIKLKRKGSLKIGWNEEEVSLLERMKLEDNSFLEHARKAWLISFYFAGLRAGDLLMLKWSDFHDGRLYYTMNKNQKSDSVKVSEKAKILLETYRELGLDHDLVLPDLSSMKDLKDKISVQKQIKYRNRKLNKALEIIRQELKVNKPLSLHISRHSFASIAGDKIPIQRLQQLYRHSSITTTINYQKAFLNKGTDDALDLVLDF